MRPDRWSPPSTPPSRRAGRRTDLLAPTGAPRAADGDAPGAASSASCSCAAATKVSTSACARFSDEELSIGDFVLTGGELAAMVVIDAVARRLPGVLGNADSPLDESFEAGLLEYPQYTRPPLFRDPPSREAAVVRQPRAHPSLASLAVAPAHARRRPDPVRARCRSATKIGAPRRRSAMTRRDDRPTAARSGRAVHHPVYDKHQKVVATALDQPRPPRHRAVHSRTLRARALLHRPSRRRAARARRRASPRTGPADRGRREERLPPPGDRAAPGRARSTRRSPAMTVAHGRRPESSPPRLDARRRALGFRRASPAAAQAPALLVSDRLGPDRELLASCDVRLPPIRAGPSGDYNHLSVRSACAIILDRVYGDRED